MEKTMIKLTDICGNEHAKRAIEVAVAGEHSIQFVGAFESQAGDLCALARKLGVTARAVTPCPCGHFGDPARECICETQMIARHRRQVFGVQREFDITVEVSIPHADRIVRWMNSGYAEGEPDEVVMERVRRAQAAPDVSSKLDASCLSLLKTAISQLALSPAQVRGVARVAATIARLSGSDHLGAAHVAEAIQYRRKAW
jgi:magnesium chelatase family protein